MRHFFIVCSCLLLFLVTACAADDGVIAPAHTSNMPAKVLLGYHYKPPQDGTPVETIAHDAAFIILTKKDEQYRDQLRAAGYRGDVLMYVMASEVNGPAVDNGQACDADYRPYANQVADQVGDFCALVDPHEDWFLHNGRGERLRTKGRPYYHMNPASAGWRAFMLERLTQRVHGDATTPSLGYDGVFLDNVELNLYKVQHQLATSDGTVQEFADDDAYRNAWRDFLKQIRATIGSDTPLWANLISSSGGGDEWNDYLPYLDGGMDEAFALGYGQLSAREYNNELRQVEYVIAQGKGFYAVSQGEQTDRQRQQFALASYLLVMQSDTPSYFRYSKSDEWYDEWWSYDNYKVELGVAKGPRYKDGSRWRRDFSHGYVVVDPTARTSEIVQQ